MKLRNTNAKQNPTNTRITYYFASAFFMIGTFLIFFIVFKQTAKINLFTFLLSLAGGGLPLGIIGIFIDYKISENKEKAVEQLEDI